MFVGLSIHPATRMRHVVVSGLLDSATFTHYLIRGTIFGGGAEYC